MMKKILSIISTVFTYSLMAQVTADVTQFGATGNDNSDDRQAIQNAINFVNSKGGGTVFFPIGTYIISPVPHPNPTQVICLKLYDNIILEGVSRDSSVIQLQNNAPNFDAMVGNNPSFQRIDNIQIRNLCFDANGMNNPVSNPSVLNNGKRSIFRIFLGKNYIIENCRFTRHKGVWCIVFNGLTENIIIRNNEFTHIGDDKVEWDHSSIYTNGDNFIVENNYFATLYGPGTKAARTAIEIHGSNQIVRNNTITGYPYGINVTGFSEIYQSYNQTYHDNTFRDVMNGFVLWSSSSSNPAASNGLSNIRIFDNTIKINSLGWQSYDFFNGGAGIVFERNRDLNIDSLYIFNNTIEFVGNPISSASKSRYSNGIAMGDNNVAGVDVSNTHILKNTITNSNGPGINFDFKLSNSAIIGNTIVNAGSSLADLFTGFRCGIYVGDTIRNVQMNCNEFRKNNTNSNLHHVFYNNGILLSNPYYFNNTQYGYSVPNITKGSFASGLNWIQTPDKPLVGFDSDSVIVGSFQTVQVPIVLRAPAATTLQVRLIPIDRNGKYNQDWLSDSQVIFQVGEQTKTVSVNNPTSGDQTHYIIIEKSNNYLIDCNAVLKIQFDKQISGNQQNSRSEVIEIFPNPARDFFIVDGQADAPFQLEIYNLQGQQLSQQTYKIGEKVPVRHLTEGIYIVKLYSKDAASRYTRKLIVHRQ